MALTLRQYLRTLDKDTLKKLFQNDNLTDYDKEILTKCFIDNFMVAKTCSILHISKTKYHYSLNEALIKLQYSLNDLDKLHTFKL